MHFLLILSFLLGTGLNDVISTKINSHDSLSLFDFSLFEIKVVPTFEGLYTGASKGCLLVLWS